MKNIANAGLMAETMRFLFAFLGKERNAPLTAMFLALCFMAWWNIRQETQHTVERYNWNAYAIKKDSAGRAERESFVGRIIELRRDVLECNAEKERLRVELERALKSKR